MNTQPIVANHLNITKPPEGAAEEYEAVWKAVNSPKNPPAG